MSFSSANFGQEQKIQKCPVPEGIGGKYKIIFETRTLGEPKRIILDVVVNSKNYTKEYLTEFAKRIKAEYCNENYLSVNIFDNKKAIRIWYENFIVSEKRSEERRGTYLLDKQTDYEVVEFSTRPGNPINEVRIELSIPKE